MNAPRRSRVGRFACAAVALAGCAAAVPVVGHCPHGHPDLRPSALALPQAAPTSVVPSRSARRSGARVERLARRFAAAWWAWDRGDRSQPVAATLRRLGVASLWRRLRDRSSWPTATRPIAVALQPIRAIRTGLASWRAVIAQRAPADGYLATLVIVATANGPRVADVEG
jgi:hypothetical protein